METIYIGPPAKGGQQTRKIRPSGAVWEDLTPRESLWVFVLPWYVTKEGNLRRDVRVADLVTRVVIRRETPDPAGTYSVRAIPLDEHDARLPVRGQENASFPWLFPQTFGSEWEAALAVYRFYDLDEEWEEGG